MILRIRLINNLRYRLCLLFVSFFGFSSCTPDVGHATEQDELPRMFPDYANVTIPYNIAPLNFKIEGDPDQVYVRITGDDSELGISGRSDVLIPLKKWKRLLARNKGKNLHVKTYVRFGDQWKSFPEFTWTVSARAIDPYLAYRRIEPGYSISNGMGIYQRNIETFEETVLVDNQFSKMGCVNCHSFCSGNPDRMLFHARQKNPGTYLYENGELVKIETRAGPMKSSAVYPYWHPTGDYVAFSVSMTRQNFHSGQETIEVFDIDSDVIVYDLKKKTVITTPALYDAGTHNNYPVFSPDGKRLYFCSGKLLTMPENNHDLKLSLCAVDFDAASGKIGKEIDTLVSAEVTGKSALHPRVSPDGKYLIYTQLDYGSFSNYHKSANLWIYDLATGTSRPMDEVNSSEVDSYHTWSSGGGWMVFSSRRIDGHYTRPWFTFVGDDGKATKPFILPQKNPDHYIFLTESYNVPELVKGRIRLDPYTIRDVAQHVKAIPSKFRMQR